jgi:ethanolamine utilization protein EutQ (cupin superfamily)
MQHASLVQEFQSGGFHDVREIQERDLHIPLTYYPHDHVYLILDGTMEIAAAGARRYAVSGDYLYIPAGRFHERRISEDGCRYLIAKRIW